MFASEFSFNRLVIQDFVPVQLSSVGLSLFWSVSLVAIFRIVLGKESSDNIQPPVLIFSYLFNVLLTHLSFALPAFDGMGWVDGFPWQTFCVLILILYYCSKPKCSQKNSYEEMQFYRMCLDFCNKCNLWVFLCDFQHNDWLFTFTGVVSNLFRFVSFRTLVNDKLPFLFHKEFITRLTMTA